MSFFYTRRKRRMPGLNTSSLPDLIFTVLFFFMIVTNMRETEVKVEYRMPQGRQIEKLTNRSTTSFIYIGRTHGGGATDDVPVQIQLNDRFAGVDDVAAFISEERAGMSDEDARNMKVCIKADRDTPMGLINDIKKVLRRSYVLDIVYSAEMDNRH